MYLYPLIFIIFSISCINAENTIHINSIKKKDGIYILKEDGNIANGLVYNTSNNNQVNMGILSSGVKHGLWTEWYPTGRRLQETYKNGLLDGSVSLFYNNGQKEWRYTYNNGVLEGRYTKWFENGKTEVEGFFEFGEPVGIWCWRNKDGAIIKKETFKKKKKGVFKGYKEYIIKESIPSGG